MEMKIRNCIDVSCVEAAYLPGKYEKAKAISKLVCQQKWSKIRMNPLMSWPKEVQLHKEGCKIRQKEFRAYCDKCRNTRITHNTQPIIQPFWGTMLTQIWSMKKPESRALGFASTSSTASAQRRRSNCPVSERWRQKWQTSLSHMRS